MIAALAVAAALAAVLAIAAEWQEHRHRAFYALKPLTTLLIAGIAAAAPGLSVYERWILIALALSLAGDICLMFASDAWFVAGLSGFLLAHLAFIAAFLQGLHTVDLPFWLAAIVVYALGLLTILLPRVGRLKPAVLVYCAVLAAMVFAAAARHHALGDAHSARALAGALLFMLSDSLLGWRRFVRRFRHAQALILSTYWAAIGLIAWSV